MARPFVNVTFPLTTHTVGAAGRFRLLEGEFKHELGILTMTASAALYPDLLTGSPVIVEWGSAERSDVFVGYVAVAIAEAVPKLLAPKALPAGASVEVYCVGATFPANEARQRVFTNVTADQIIQQVMGNYQLDTVVLPDNRVWNTYSQAGLTDWAFSVGLAHDVGYTLFSRNTQVVFRPRSIDLQRSLNNALSYDFTGTGSNSTVPGSAQVFSFSPTVSNLGTDGSRRRRRVLYDLDRRTGKVIAVEDTTGPSMYLAPQGMDPLFTEFVTQMSADNISDATNWLVDMAEDQRWYITAEATVQGDTRLAPSEIVYFANLPADFSGYWYVTSVTHDIQVYPGAVSDQLTSSYTCYLTLGRDGVGESVVAPTGAPSRTLNNLLDLGTPAEATSVAQLTPEGYWRANFLTGNVPTN